MQTLNVFLCSFFGLVDCLKDQMDETAEVYYLSNGSENQLLKLSRTLVPKEKSQISRLPNFLLSFVFVAATRKP